MEDTEGWWHPQATAVGREGTLELVARGTAALTYRELCVPDDLEHRGVTDIPNYHYRDDALEIWGAIERWGGGHGHGDNRDEAVGDGDMEMGMTKMGTTGWDRRDGTWGWGRGDGTWGSGHEDCTLEMGTWGWRQQAWGHGDRDGGGQWGWGHGLGDISDGSNKDEDVGNGDDEDGGNRAGDRDHRVGSCWR